ncbi:hypothetical protein C2S53_011259 [Perilla frutescens var. hirtella]|uniref:DUF4378 domain-containing protein n=1 Tax=Perilla frutescens var. hirtella TaxID=608512 RepID=A0AAD4IVW2_PERFH|nr:hypothetical protein C2S53_011259 [Perilla frutescens var. hirtella]
MPKLLADFLQEQQEPFALEVYLLERGYAKQYSSAKCVVPNCSDFLRAMFNQFIVANEARKKSKSRRESAGEDGFSSASSSESDVGGSHCSEAAIRRFVKCGNCFLEGEGEGEGEVDAANLKSKMIMRAEEDSKQLSPVSVLGETELDEDSSIHFKRYNFKARRGESSNSRSYYQYLINTTALQQRKQLLIDCTRLVIEECREKEKNRGDIKNILGGEDEWSVNFEQKKFEICVEIENLILENVINEIITLINS